MKEEKVVKIFLELLKVCNEEGEDILLYEILEKLPNNSRDFITKNFKDYLELPPRIFFAKIMFSKKWSKYFLKASQKLLNE